MVQNRDLMSYHVLLLTPPQVEELLPKGVSSIPELSAALVTVSKALDSEMASMPAHEVRERHHSSSSSACGSLLVLSLQLQCCRTSTCAHSFRTNCVSDVLCCATGGGQHG